jgi:dihydroorotate dehydrogenase electron transfer subunit
MYQLTRELAAGGVKPDVFFGFRDKPYCMEEYRSIANSVKVSTDTGAVGFHGFVTQLYDPADYDVVLVCGPTVMMRNAARLCAEKGTPCFVSLEKKMACGIGACLGCTCETRSGEGKSVCKNGPVFDAAEVF